MPEMKDPETKIKVFMSRAENMGYVFRNGTTVHFMQHQYATESEEEITELTKECKNNHPNFYIDPARHEITIAQLDPNYELREQIRAEERARIMAAMGDPARDMGFTPQDGRLKGVANSHSILGMQADNVNQAAAAHTGAQPPVSPLGVITPGQPTAKKL